MEFRKLFDELEKNEDYLGISHLMLDVLMRPDQEKRPDADLALLEQRAPALIRGRFQIPDAITYPSIFRDQHIAAADRGSWAKDRYVGLIITSYLLGAARENLPHPHDQLVKYYRDTAAKQQTVLLQIAAANTGRKSKMSDFAGRVAAIQAEYKRRKEVLPTLGLDEQTLERLEEAEDKRFRDAVLNLGDSPDFNY